jgi:hypothetical protein
MKARRTTVSDDLLTMAEVLAEPTITALHSSLPPAVARDSIPTPGYRNHSSGSSKRSPGSTWPAGTST